MTAVSFHTLGCKMNQAETEQLKDSALSSGHEIVDFGEPCDICVINTCTVTAVADKKSRQAIRKAIRLSNGNVYVTGCLAEVDRNLIEKIDERLKILLKGAGNWALDGSTVLTARAKGLETGQDNIFYKYSSPATSPQPLVPLRLRSNLIIQTGCDNFCSYCIVPYARGREKDRPFDEIVCEAKKMADSGIKELVLTGINTGAFKKLPELLEELSHIKGPLRIRLSSVEPLNINSKLISAISTNRKVCRHLHIPLQSGDDTVLKNMNRKYTAKDYAKVVGLLRERMPDMAISTDVIAGFPGETEEQFQNTLNFIKKTGFTRLHVFRFSKRKGTPAAEMKGQIDPKTIAKRAKILQRVRAELMLDHHRSIVGKTVEVLIEQRDKKTGLLEGLTDKYVRVFAKGTDKMIGKIVPIKIIKPQIEHAEGSITDQTYQTG